MCRENDEINAISKFEECKIAPFMFLFSTFWQELVPNKKWCDFALRLYVVSFFRAISNEKVGKTKDIRLRYVFRKIRPD